MSSDAVKALIGGPTWWSDYQGISSILGGGSIVTGSLGGDSSLPGKVSWQNHHRFLGERLGGRRIVYICAVKIGQGPLKSGKGPSWGCSSSKSGLWSPDLEHMYSSCAAGWCC